MNYTQDFQMMELSKEIFKNGNSNMSAVTHQAKPSSIIDNLSHTAIAK